MSNFIQSYVFSTKICETKIVPLILVSTKLKKIQMNLRLHTISKYKLDKINKSEKAHVPEPLYL